MSHDASPVVAPESTHGATGGQESHNPEHHAHGTGEYWVVFVLLSILMIATVAAAFFNLGHFNVPVAYLIACLKAGLILWFFMHLKYATRLTQVFAFASFAWLALMLLITAGDYLSRTLLPRADSMTHIRKVDSYQVVSGIERAALPGTGHGGHEAGEKHEGGEKAEGGEKKEAAPEAKGTGERGGGESLERK